MKGNFFKVKSKVNKNFFFYQNVKIVFSDRQVSFLTFSFSALAVETKWERSTIAQYMR